ncbi:hypothetical protein RHGRI_003774 [Rhododendron griersonianum]|uniref:Uncharacterized protein n=1 Tax=Rhododendron griersonianum TaxID=479676 RepID=A0AAV6L8V1_9ERIC|nr:hypothetical protein RHGRI_003774 [Rhododendron griersonianum]
MQLPGLQTTQNGENLSAQRGTLLDCFFSIFCIPYPIYLDILDILVKRLKFDSFLIPISISHQSPFFFQ